MKLKGTGKDPLGRYSEGLIYDIQDGTDELQDHLDRGWGEELPPEEHPGRTELQIANSMIRNDPLVDPVEQKIAKEIGDRAYAIVHTGDPEASAEEAQPSIDEESENVVAPPTGRQEPGAPTTFAETREADAARSKGAAKKEPAPK